MTNLAGFLVGENVYLPFWPSVVTRVSLLLVHTSVASNIYLTREAPEFPTGYGVAFGFIGVEAVLAVLFMMGLKRENRKRGRGERDWRFSLPKEELENLGDDHPDYRFNY
jgi:hypothetical protein